MNGTLQKIIPESALACAPCASFRTDDPDVYYCLEQREEFPGLCEAFTSRTTARDRRMAGCVPLILGES